MRIMTRFITIPATETSSVIYFTDRNNATKTEVEIDNYCGSCKTAKCNANPTLKTHRRTHIVCPVKYITLLVSVAGIVINLVIILIVGVSLM
jgi:ribosomal protein L33